MAKRTWNFVDEFFSENELQSYIIQNVASIKRTDPGKLERLGKRRGRPKKAGPALSR